MTNSNVNKKIEKWWRKEEINNHFCNVTLQYLEENSSSITSALHITHTNSSLTFPSLSSPKERDHCKFKIKLFHCSFGSLIASKHFVFRTSKSHQNLSCTKKIFDACWPYWPFHLYHIKITIEEVKNKKKQISLSQGFSDNLWPFDPSINTYYSKNMTVMVKVICPRKLKFIWL